MNDEREMWRPDDERTDRLLNGCAIVLALLAMLVALAALTFAVVAVWR